MGVLANASSPLAKVVEGLADALLLATMAARRGLPAHTRPQCALLSRLPSIPAQRVPIPAGGAIGSEAIRGAHRRRVDVVGELL